MGRSRDLADGTLSELNVDSNTLAVDATNNRVGIGTGSPAAQLQVFAQDSAAGKAIRAAYDGTYYSEFTEAGIHCYNNLFTIDTKQAQALVFGTNNTERMRIDSSGNVGIGTSNPSFKVDLKMSSSARTGGLVIRRSLNDSHQLGLWTDSGEMYFDAITDNASAAGITVFRRSLNSGTSFAESMRIDSSGRIKQAGTSNGNGAFNFVGELVGSYKCCSFERTASGGEVGSIVANTTSTSYNTSSDYRLKENVVEVTDGISRVKLLKPSRFNFIADPDKTVDGFLAHEVSDVVPEAIHGTKDAMKTEEYEVTPAVEATYDEEGNELTPAVEAVRGTREVPDYQGIDQSKLVPLLTAALQEAIAKIESLETEMITVKSRLDALESA